MALDALLASGMRAMIRERNNNFYYCEQLTSNTMHPRIGKLVTQYCYGDDCVIPERVVDILLGNLKFKMLGDSIEYRYEFGEHGRYDGMCIVFGVGTKNAMNYYPDDEEWMDFLLTGYNKSVYQTKAIPSSHRWVRDVEYDIPSKDLDVVRREMIDAAGHA